MNIKNILQIISSWRQSYKKKLLKSNWEVNLARQDIFFCNLKRNVQLTGSWMLRLSILRLEGWMQWQEPCRLTKGRWTFISLISDDGQSWVEVQIDEGEVNSLSYHPSYDGQSWVEVQIDKARQGEFNTSSYFTGIGHLMVCLVPTNMGLNDFNSSFHIRIPTHQNGQS